MVCPEPTALKRGGKSLATKELGEARVSQARTVLTFAPDLAPGVLSGSV